MNAYGACTIGGSSAINAGLFFEPPASDWDLYFPEGVSGLLAEPLALVH
jgi:cellobiose dehydrogenase (acceptor)